jgi:hypothetical protein
MPRIAEGDASERDHDAQLRHDNPGATSPERRREEGRIISIKKWRPHPLQLVGDGELAEEAVVSIGTLASDSHAD